MVNFKIRKIVIFSQLNVSISYVQYTSLNVIYLVISVNYIQV